jgi:phage terminase large subunit-like protein
MRSQPTEREIQQQFEEVIQQHSPRENGEIRVLWGAADPEHRPEGMTWVSETNTLTYDLWGAQRDALDTLNTGETDITAFLAGYGSGKTIFGARWLITQALRHDGSRFLGMGIDFTKARDTTFRVLFEQLPGDRTGLVTSSYNGPETSPVVSDYNRQNHRLTLTNDTVIKLGSADRWNRYAGDEYGGVWLDEPSHYGEDLHDLLEMIGSRLRGVHGPKVQLWTLTGNGHNAAFDILQRKVDSDGQPLGLNIELIQASTLENPYLDPGEKERFERQYGNTSRETQALYGGFAASSGALLSRDQLQFIHKNEIDDDTKLRYYLGVDLAYVSSKAHAEATDSDYTAVALVGYNPTDQQAYLIDVARTRGNTLRESIQWLANIANQVPNPTIRIEKVGAQTFWIQEAKQNVPGTIVPVTPDGGKEERLQDLALLAERGDLLIVEKEKDDALGYDERFQPFVREWVEFGNSDNSPDLLDSCYYAVSDLPLSESASTTILSADPFGKGRDNHTAIR